MSVALLTEIQITGFKQNGFIIVPQMVEKEVGDRLKEIANEHLSELIAPVEYELDVHYPGAPADEMGLGARTSRRLLQVFARDEGYRRWATSNDVKVVLEQLFGDSEIALSQCHHNCIMTKEPNFSSVTLWHQDIRYWSFDQQNLVSVWLALGTENKANGCLRVIPGSHLFELDPGRFDASLFLRPDLPENKSLISQAEVVELDQGDVLFFHSKLFHAAGRNLTDNTKYSLVFSYHQVSNKPIEGTRSARFPSIPL